MIRVTQQYKLGSDSPKPLMAMEGRLETRVGTHEPKQKGLDSIRHHKGMVGTRWKNRKGNKGHATRMPMSSQKREGMHMDVGEEREREREKKPLVCVREWVGH